MKPPDMIAGIRIVLLPARVSVVSVGGFQRERRLCALCDIQGVFFIIIFALETIFS